MKPSNQRLFKEREELKDERTLAEYGFTANSAKPQKPGSIGLAFRYEKLTLLILGFLKWIVIQWITVYIDELLETKMAIGKIWK